MNIIEFLKKGSGIHIKPENKGKFTDYCNGKVTSECIARGKRSSDPSVRKRATFADNARHFKHRSGGLIVKVQEGGKINFWLKAGNFLSSDSGKTLINGVSQLYNGIKNSSKANDFRVLDNERILKGKQSIINDVGDVSNLAENYVNYLRLINPDIHYGTVDLQQIQQELTNNLRLKNKIKADLWELEQLEKLNGTILSILGSGNNGILSSLGGLATSILNNKSIISKKNPTESNSNSNTFFTNPSLGKSQGSMPDFNFGVKSSFGTF